MNFLFEITQEYTPSYAGKSVFRCKVYYEVRDEKVINVNVMFPLNVLLYIADVKELHKDINDAILKHAEAFLEEEKEFNTL